jgi:hypothetical protein
MLNDEANLIYISKADNQKKGNDFKFLRDLHKDYKQDIFGNKSDDEIKAFIFITSIAFNFIRFFTFNLLKTWFKFKMILLQNQWNTNLAPL